MRGTLTWVWRKRNAGPTAQAHTPNWFHDRHPFGGTIARPLSSAALGSTAAAAATSSSAESRLIACSPASVPVQALEVTCGCCCGSTPRCTAAAAGRILPTSGPAAMGTRRFGVDTCPQLPSIATPHSDRANGGGCCCSSQPHVRPCSATHARNEGRGGAHRLGHGGPRC